MHLHENRRLGVMAQLGMISLCLKVFLGSMASAISAEPHLKRDSIEGIWINDTGQGAIQIRPCSSAADIAGMCGYIVWIHPDTRQNKPLLLDSLNPDPEKRQRLICGLQVIGRLQRQENGTWDKGWIYDPKKGKSFDVTVSRVSENNIQVTGYMGIKLFSQSFVWERAQPNIELCAQ